MSGQDAADTLSDIRLRSPRGRRAWRHARHSVHDKTVCIIDDEWAVRQSLESLVRAIGARVQLYDSAEAFLEHGRHDASHCIVCDIRMTRMSGLELLACMRARACDVPFIFVTAHLTAHRELEARRLGALCVLEKPFDPAELVQWMTRALGGR
nr:response regulator [Burkholderia multivorans]